MKKFESYSRVLPWLMALLLSALVAACGGADGGRDPILGLSSLVSVAVTPATASIPISGIQQFTATATYSDGSSRDVTASSSWASGTTSAATVNSTSGLATGVAIGNSVITATYSGKTGTATLTVTSATLTSIAVTPATASIPISGIQQFTATATYSDGTTSIVTASSSWTSGTTSVATVNSASGLAIGVAAGTSVITATYAGKPGTATLTVTNVTLTSISVTPATASIPMAGTQQFTATATYSDASTVNVTAASSWSSATTSFATVNSTSGLATGVAGGSSVITATFGGKSATGTLTVTNVTLTSIAVTPATASIPIAGSQNFTATATFSDASTTDVTLFSTWTSSDTSVATINNSGGALGVNGGTSVITATYAGKPGTATLTVTSVTLTSIAVTPATASIPMTGTQQYTATATYSDLSNADVTAFSSWTSGTTSVATISTSGLATGVTVGTSIITATFGGQPGTATLTVNADVNLGRAVNFGVLSGTILTNTTAGTTLVTGDVGAYTQTVAPPNPGYANYTTNPAIANAVNDMKAAVDNVSSRTCFSSYAGDTTFTNSSLIPGIYCVNGAIIVSGTFTLNGPGVYIIRATTTLDSTTGASVGYAGGATELNTSVFWVPVGATTLGAPTAFKGTIMSKAGAITLMDGANVNKGRVLSGAAVTMNANNIIAIP